jgi:uncharacterized protein YlzI (FlbEa/FlbD family)
MLIVTAPGKVYAFNVFHISSAILDEAAKELTVTLINGKSYIFICENVADFNRFMSDLARLKKEATALFTRI